MPILAQGTVKPDSLLSVYAAQATDTQKVATAYALYDFYYGHDPLQALGYSREGLKLSRNLGYTRGIAQNHYHEGRQFRNNRQLDSALNRFLQAQEIYQELGDRHEVGLMLGNEIIVNYLGADYPRALSQIEDGLKLYYGPPEDSIVVMNLLGMRARINMRKTEYQAGIRDARTALEYSRRLGEENKQAQYMGTLASLFHYTNDKNKSIEYKQEALAIYRRQNRQRQVAVALNDIGNSLYAGERYQEAMPYLQESLELGREYQLYGHLGIVTYNIGRTYIEQGEIEKGIEYLRESIEISQTKSHSPLVESWALNTLASTYTESLNQPARAIPMLNRAIALADSIGNRDDLYQSYRDRSQAFANSGNYQEALQDHRRYKAISDSVNDVQKSRDIERLKTEFDTERKERQLAMQEKEITVLGQQASINRLQRIVLAVALVLAGILVYALRQRMKRNQLERQKVAAELEFKKKELTTHAFNLARKNETLESIKSKARELQKQQDAGKGYAQLIRTINFDQADENNWEQFAHYFEEVHKDFHSNVKAKYPDISSNDLRLLALLKMNLTSKEIANILNISPEGIKKARYRLRKKLNLSTEDSLEEFALAQ